MSRLLRLLAALFVVLAPVATFAQGGGVVTGTVADETGGVLPGVTVELRPMGAQDSLEAVTDGVGVFRFEQVPAGAAELTFRLNNFSAVRRRRYYRGGNAAGLAFFGMALGTIGANTRAKPGSVEKRSPGARRRPLPCTWRHRCN